MQHIFYKEAEIASIAQQIIHACASKTLCFHGEMGAGKTTLIKALVQELGGADGASSPTFGIVNEYQRPDGTTLAYHFDFYRLEEETEALDLGFEEYLDQKVWVFIEWPNKIISFLPENACHIHIEIVDKHTRQISPG